MKLKVNAGMYTVALSSWQILSSKGKSNFPMLLLALAFMTLAESATVAIVFPLVNALTNNDFSTYQKLSAYIPFAIDDWRNLAVIGSMVLVLFALIIRSVVTYFQNQFIEHERASVSVSLTEKYAHMEFLSIVNVKKTDVERNVLAEVDILFGQFFRPALTIFSNLLLSLFIFGILMTLSPLLTVAALLLFISYVLMLYLVVRRKLTTLGQIRLDQNAKRFSYLSQITRGIKDLKIKRIEDVFVALFSKASHAQADATADTQSITAIPNYILESFILISLMGYFALITSSQTFGEGLLSAQITATFAVGLIRLIPSFKGIFQAIARIRNNATVLNTISDALADYAENSGRKRSISSTATKDGHKIQDLVKIKSLKITNLGFSYPNSHAVFDGLDFDFIGGAWYAITGPSGSGKSTFVDIISGLLEPELGECIANFDDESTRNINNFAEFGAYTPQQSLIFPGNFYENIALGVPSKDIDLGRVEKVAEICQLGPLIREFSNGFQTIVGDGGTTLSGGQAQRIGIARTLYRQPKIIIFDESTSALDEVTEKKILIGIREYLDSSLVLMIAHKKTVIDFCDFSVQIS